MRTERETIKDIRAADKIISIFASQKEDYDAIVEFTPLGAIVNINLIPNSKPDNRYRIDGQTYINLISDLSS